MFCFVRRFSVFPLIVIFATMVFLPTVFDSKRKKKSHLVTQSQEQTEKNCSDFKLETVHRILIFTFCNETI